MSSENSKANILKMKKVGKEIFANLNDTNLENLKFNMSDQVAKVTCSFKHRQ